MDTKLLSPTLSVMLVKTIKALCEINIQYDHKLEITGSLHVRSDGDKVLTCLLDEETVKGQHDTTARVAELAARLSLANAAFSFQHVQLPAAAHSVSHPQQVAEAFLNSMQGNVDFSSYILTQQQQQQPTSLTVDRCRPMATEESGSHQALRVSPISPVDERSSAEASTYTEIKQKGRSGDTGSSTGQRQKNGVNESVHRHRRVDTVAKTLAAIKASNSVNVSRSESAAAASSNQSNQNHVKLPDIQTLAHRLPSFHSIKSEAANQIDAVALADGDNQQIILAATANADQDVMSVTYGAMSNASILEAAQSKASDFDGSPVHRKKFQCMFCGIFLSTKCYLKNHINAMHTRSRVYQCELCEHYFYSAGAMRIHKLRNHWQDSKKHKCTLCGETFLLPIELRKHIQKKHYGSSEHQILLEAESSKLEPGELPSSRGLQMAHPGYAQHVMSDHGMGSGPGGLPSAADVSASLLASVGAIDVSISTPN